MTTSKIDLREEARKAFEKNTNLSVGKFIDDGAQGKVYNIKEHRNKIVKISMLYDRDVSPIEEIFSNIQNIYFWIKDNPQDVLVKIFEFGKLTEGERPFYPFIKDQKYISYFSIQEKLIKLSVVEEKVFRNLAYNMTQYYHTDEPFFTQNLADDPLFYKNLPDFLKSLKEKFDFDQNKILNFYSNLEKLQIYHNDFRPENIMKDKKGNFKLIDFDLSEFKINK
jgi:thiamine kinase-like enzyme